MELSKKHFFKLGGNSITPEQPVNKNSFNVIVEKIKSSIYTIP